MEPADEELMKNYQLGNSQAFDALYQRHARRVYGYLKRRLSRIEWVDECFQMTFSKFHRTRHLYDPNYSVEQWLFVIAKTTLMDQLRKQAREQAIQQDIEIEDLPDGLFASVPVYATVGPDLQNDTHISLDALTAQQQQVVQWRAVDELSYKEIATKLNQSEDSVRQIYSRSIKKLRSFFRPEKGGQQ